MMNEDPRPSCPRVAGRGAGVYERDVSWGTHGVLGFARKE